MHYNPYFYPSSEHEEERQFPFPWSLLTPIFGPSTPPPGGGGFPGGGFPGGGFPGGGQQGPGSGGQFSAHHLHHRQALRRNSPNFKRLPLTQGQSATVCSALPMSG